MVARGLRWGCDGTVALTGTEVWFHKMEGITEVDGMCHVTSECI